MLKTSEYGIRVDNYVTVKKYGDDLFKFVLHKQPVRLAGFEEIGDKKEPKIIVDTADKRGCNLARARSTVFELAYCNKWDYFFTGTLAPANGDRTNLDAFHKGVAQFIRDERKRTGCDIKYLLVPELHADLKSWHEHGAFANLPEESLYRFVEGDVMGKHIADKVLAGEEVYKWPRYEHKFGWCDLEPIKTHEGLSKYLTKYISKSIVGDDSRSVKELDKHLYYCSQGLKRAETIKKGILTEPIASTHWEFENDYIATFSTRDIGMFKYLEDIISPL